MKKIIFSVEEMNVIHIYQGKTKDLTVASMSNVSKYIPDPEMKRIMNQAVEKLRRISEEEYKAIQFVLTDE